MPIWRRANECAFGLPQASLDVTSIDLNSLEPEVVQVRQKALPFLLTFNCCSFLDSAFPLLLSGQRLSWWFGLSVAVPLPLCHGSALPCGSAALGHRHCLSLVFSLPFYKIKKTLLSLVFSLPFYFLKDPAFRLHFHCLSVRFCRRSTSSTSRRTAS